MNNAINKSKKQVSFRVDAGLAKRMQEAASKEALPTNLGDFTRQLLLWAVPHYRAASSLWLLRRAVVTMPKLTMPGEKKRKTRGSGA